MSTSTDTAPTGTAGDGKPDATATKPDAEADKGKGTDEELNDGGKAALEKERAARREAEKQLKEAKAKADKLDEIENANKSELTKAQERAAQLEKDLADRDTRLLRLEVAAAKGLTPGQAKRLVGSTKEELEADADDLLKELKPEGGSTTTTTRVATADQRASGGGADKTFSDILREKARGGG